MWNNPGLREAAVRLGCFSVSVKGIVGEKPRARQSDRIENLMSLRNCPSRTDRLRRKL